MNSLFKKTLATAHMRSFVHDAGLEGGVADQASEIFAGPSSCHDELPQVMWY